MTRVGDVNRELGSCYPRIKALARLPGASTAPATRTRTRIQTGVVKQQRNTDS
jgi:hypothetical protein